MQYGARAEERWRASRLLSVMVAFTSSSHEVSSASRLVNSRCIAGGEGGDISYVLPGEEGSDASSLSTASSAGGGREGGIYAPGWLTSGEGGRQVGRENCLGCEERVLALRCFPGSTST
jgi:hypothetical protein